MNKTACRLAAVIFATLSISLPARGQTPFEVQAWYAGAIAGLVGPSATAEDACNYAKPFFVDEQVTSGAHPNSWITSLISASGGVCYWNGSVPGNTGPYGQVAIFGSAYNPPAAYSNAVNGGKGCVDIPCNDPDPANCPCPTCYCPPEGNPINPATGNKLQEETDYVAQGPHALRFVRYYNSFSNNGLYGGFGAGWTHTYSRRVLADGTSMVVSKREDGRSLRFTLSGSVYVPDSSSVEKLERITTPSLGWKLTNAQDQIEEYDDSGKLLSITDRAGLVQTLTYGTNGKVATVTDPYGQTLTFTWGNGLRITSIVAPSGTITYAYTNDVYRKVVSVTHPGSATRAYHYENTTFKTKLTGITDENGDRFSTYAYDSSGRANSTEHAGGANKVTFTHDSSTGARSVLVTRHVSATQSAQRTYGFETIGGLARRTSTTANSGEPCPTCGPASQSNDSNANATVRIDWNGNRTNYTFDTSRNLETARTEGLTSSSSTTAQTRTITTQWHSTFRLRTGVAEPLRITTFTYDATGSTCGARGAMCSKSIQATSDANGSQGFSATAVGSPRTWSYTYNANGSLLTVNGPRTDVSDVTTYTYYANNASCPTTNGGHGTGCRGQIETITNSLSQVTSILAYDALGQAKYVTDPNGLAIAIAYNARGNPLTRSVGGETTTYEYDPAEQLTKVTLPDSSYLSYSYDDAHRLTQLLDNLGNRIVYTLDGMGNRTAEQVRDPSNTLVQTRSRVFSNINRLYREIGASSQTTEYGYDDQGNVLTVKDPLNQVTTNQYDALNRLKQVTSPTPISAVAQYAYDGLDQLVSVTDPRSFVTGYTVNGLGNLTQQASPDTGTTTSTYDVAGNLLTQTDAKSQTTTYAYDALNRVTSITFHDGSKQNYTYDAGTNGIGRLAGIAELNPSLTVVAQIAYGYDQKGRVTSETRTINAVAYTTAYRYDSSGRLDRITYPSGRTVDYSFDSLGRISAVSTTPSGGSSQAIASSITYHPFGGVTGFSFANGQTYARTYDQDGRIATYTLAGTGYTVGYDAASRITFITETANPPNTNTYGYDALDRLTSATLPATVYGYTYDAVGNRLTRSASGGSDTYAYSTTSNRIASITPTSGPVRSFTLDNNGSTTADGTNTYAYDTRGRMVQAVSSLGTTTYHVNALGQRVRKTNSLDDRVFHYDLKGHLIAESTASGTPLREYVWLGDMPVAVVNGTSRFYVHADHLNTPRLVTNDQQQAVWRWDQQEPFGLNVPDEDPSSLGAFEFALRFPGQYADKETNLYYNYFRDC
jgi:YD repeat-containing protein